ncbi:DUF2513 domain-containing protein [Clostridium gasigenes]|uniref:DUF2513 domain-containing protein n=1 Tax=Clostridium gasigenes TaxID=94869 RepID=A0A1H0M5U2_9CLOT|nr:DUF2513 domain-containing protein [Clostridium gasigenes]SDO75735.1 Hypothetical protein SAMN04488529_101331 [Clostridium gasigenes]
MKLNLDCIRDILLTVEDNTDFSTYMSYDVGESSYDLLTKYSDSEILYHIKQCELSGLITKVSWYLNGSCTILDLSPYGHQFLADIRSDSNWNKTKSIAKNIGSSSLTTVKEIATNVITELIKSQF